MEAEPAHILVVDDDDRLRELLRKFLSENGFLAATARHAEDARAKLASASFDLIVLDVMMPGENGFDLASDLGRNKTAAILMLTAMGETADRIKGLERGADDYLAKPFEPRELLLRIHSILRRRPRPKDVSGRVVLGEVDFDLRRHELRRGGSLVRLTSVEATLLAALAERAGVVLGRDELNRLTGATGGGRAVDVQVTRLRRKIEPDPHLPRYLLTIRGQGYVLHPD
ncbi:MAG TPA: response regulator [Rhodospirillales bacterium]|jgi:two-component system phosphate regulon response regulator OmpR|nr:response regulator [Rhodospirillales bacterium]HJO68441.1 response regulator [Rhodospirillales bacterium]